MNCPKCGGAMEPGHVQALVGGGIGPMQRVLTWIEGLPEKNFLGGLKPGRNNRRQLPITIYRCVECGYLEHYARNPRKPKE